MLQSPLEQFLVLPLVNLGIGSFDLSITNVTWTSFFCMSLIFAIHHCLQLYGLTLVPTRWQLLLEKTLMVASNLVQDSLGKNGQKYFPIVLVVFTFIMVLNVSGVVPYSFVITSHLISTMALSLIIFVGTVVICLSAHGGKMLTLFFPGGTPLLLAFLLVPLELISYVFKPISLGVRLFANMMAGHTLLKVIAGFGWTLVSKTGGLSWIIHLLPLFVLVILFGLEIAVGFIQAYVFSVLTCIYINDALNLH